MSNLMRRFMVLAVLALAALQESHAAEIEPCAVAYEAALTELPDAGPAQVWTVINGEREVGCILGATDTTGIRQLYLDLQSLSTGSDRAVKRAQLFDRAVAQFDGIQSSDCENNSTACVVGRHVKAIRDTRELLNAGQPNLASPGLRLDDWAVVIRDGEIRFSKLRLQPFLALECQEDVVSARCSAAVEVAAKILRSSEAMAQAIVAHAMPIIEANESFLSLRDKEWDSYFNEVSVQYPWELALNSWQFQKKVPVAERAGFPRAPEQKLIALHPVPAFEYADVGGDHSTQAAVVVELFGYERWRWREGKAANRVGISLAASFSDVPGADPIGYGLMIHTPIRNMSIGAVWRDGDAGESINFVFNMDPAALIQQYRDVDVKDFLKLQ
jgi:hypothetical protein